jgi:hypothetical protein
MGVSERDPRRTHGARGCVGGIELPGIEKVGKLKGGEEEPATGYSPFPWVSPEPVDSLEYPAESVHVFVAAPRLWSVSKNDRMRRFDYL